MNKIIIFFNSYIEKNNSILINISLAVSLLYFVIRFIDCLFLISFPIGDERVYVKEFNYFIENGMLESLSKGMSTIFTLLSFFVHTLTGLGDFSVRISGALSTLSLIFYFHYRLKFSNLYDKKLFFTLLLFLIPTTGASIHATNDSMFFLFFSMFIFESFIIDKKEKNNSLFKLLSSTMMISTRPVIIVYLGIIFIGVFFYFLISNKKKYVSFLKDLVIPIFLGLFFTVLMSSPNILNNQFSLSFSDKSISKERGVTWTEWVYHSQKIGNSSSRFGFFAPMLKWEEAYEYKLKYGDESLPNSYPEYLTHDISFILRRTISSLLEIFFISIRYVVFLLFLLPIFMLKKYLNKDFDRNMQINCIALSGIVVWAFIWPGLVQHRWLFPFYLLVIYSISKETNKLKKYFNNKIIPYNLIVLNIIVIWFFWKEKFFAGI